MKKSLLMVNTGDGKGKTTAALGLAFRALGHGQKVCVIQFIKGSWKYGEIDTAAKLNGHLEFHVMGRGFTWKSDNLEEDAAVARDAWEMAKAKIQSGKYRLVILDEMTYLFLYRMLDEAEVIEFLKSRPDDVHVMVTGRGASQNLIEAADMVTEMRPIKHHYQNGIKAQKGVEF